jgi:glycosyltransferase involved in cell wall biosynthesis
MYHGNFVASVLGWMARGRVPVVWNIRQSLHAIEKEKLMTRTMIAMGAALSRWQAGIVFNSRVSATQHQRLGYRGLLLRVLPNGFDCERFKPSISAGRTLRAELGVEAGVEIVGMVARYHPVKDHQNFLRAAALLAKRRRNVHFVLAGAAVDAENHVLQKLINCLELKGRVHLLGARSDVEMIAAGLSVATLSSWSEAFPNAIGEAMSCGVPCVVTRVGDAGDLVGDSGVVVPPKDASALADGWERILALSATDRSALGEMARKRISDNYKMQHVAALYESFYDDVLGGKE